jgi:hypothetical protein
MNKRGLEINLHLTKKQNALPQATACACADAQVPPENFVAFGE